MSAKIDYTEIDEEIIAHLELKARPFWAFAEWSVGAKAKSLCEGGAPGSFTRVIDRRLQALRKAGRIEFDKASRCWRLVAQEGGSE